MRRRLLLLLPLLVSGCGGSGGGSGASTRVGPVVRVSWPVRAREFGAPSAATAAWVVFPQSGKKGADQSEVILRPTGPGAAVKEYTLAMGITPGIHVMRVIFLATAEQSAPLAIATANVQVAADGTLSKVDGTPLGTIGFDSQVTSLWMSPAQAIEIGETLDPEVMANTNMGVAALRPGAVTYSVTQGSDHVRANADGTLTGLAAGDATVVPSVDGVTGTPTTVTVLPAPWAVREVSVPTNGFVYDATRNRLWLALPPTATNGNSVQGLDATTGSLGASISLGAEPTSLAIAGDDSRLYVGFFTASFVTPIDLATGTAGTAIELPPNQNGATVAADIAVQPGHPETIAVAPVVSPYSYGLSPLIFDNGVVRPNGGAYSSGTRVLWTSTSSLLDYTGYSSGSVYSYSVDAQGVSQTSYSGSLTNSYLLLVNVGGRLYNRDGAIFDGATLDRVGAFALPTDSNPGAGYYGPAIDLGRKRAYFLQVGSGFVRLRAFDTDTRLETSSRRLATVAPENDGSDVQLTRVGANGLAFRFKDRVVFVDDVTGL